MKLKVFFLTLIILLSTSMAAGAGHYKSFKVSSYIRAQDVARMADKHLRDSLWDIVSSQIDLDKIYIETHRDSFIVDEATLTTVIRFFRDKGLEIGGGITYTISEPRLFETYSYARPADRKAVRHIAEYTARFFDDIILDDFFFNDIKNDDEIAAKGDRSWTDYRLEQMTAAGKELVMDPAHQVNPNARIIIKYPNWYDHFQGLGFDLENEPLYFDGLWAGTETRDPAGNQHLQNYLSYNIIRYFDNIAPGKNGGGWVDSGGVNMSMDRYNEQVHLTMLTKTPEIILWNYMQLAQVAIRPGQKAAWQDGTTSWVYDEIVAPRQRDGKTIHPSTLASYASAVLRQDDRFVYKLGNPVGLVSYKPYHSAGEAFLQNYLGMIGLPMDMMPSFPEDRQQILLTQQAADDPEIVEKIKAQLRRGGDVIITTGLLKEIQDALADVCELYCQDLKAIVDDFGRYGQASRAFIIPQVKYYTNDAWETVSAGRPLSGGVSGYPILLFNNYSKGRLYVLTIPDDFGNLYDYPAGALNAIRSVMSKDVGYYLEAPSKVALFPYDNGTFVVQNFNDEAVDTKVVFNEEARALINLEKEETLTPDVIQTYGRIPSSMSRRVFSIRIPAHSYRVYSIERE
jgi:hypothetical protein